MAQLKKTIGALFCVLCLVVPLTSGESVAFIEDCITPVAHVSGVDVSPFPVHLGQTFTAITISASTDKEIDGGVLEIFTTDAGIPIDKRDLCETTTCPITDGAFTIAYTESIPQITPGQNEYRIQAIDDDGSTLICVSFGIEVVP